MHNDRATVAALSALILLQLVMLSALYAGVAPHPPVATPLFGMAPFLAASFAVAFSAILLGPLNGKAGRSLSGLAVVLALVSFGPQKYFDAQFALIWPAVISGQIAAIVVLVHIFGTARTPQLITS
ncbi:MAG: hypothetical protein ACSHXW_11940 [Yoonia sp.]